MGALESAGSQCVGGAGGEGREVEAVGHEGDGLAIAKKQCAGGREGGVGCASREFRLRWRSC